MEGNLTVYCQPGARQTRVAGLYNGRPKIQLKAPPVDGKANQALIAFVAELCRRPKTAVRIASGESSRVKRIVVQGMTDDALRTALADARDVLA